MLKNFEDLIKLAQKKGRKKVAVAMAEDPEILKALAEASELGIVEPILIGNRDGIEMILKDLEVDISGLELIDIGDEIEGSQKAVELVKNGQADLLMKGLLPTARIMGAVLNRENGLRKGELISHLALFQSPYYHKIFGLTDAAMNIAPDLEDKLAIVDNALEAFRKLGVEEPKVAYIAASEKASDKMPASLEARDLELMNKEGKIKNCILEGPFALDNAISKEAARHKGIKKEVAGDADILLVPDIEAGNILYKALNFLGGAESAGIILGAEVPVVLTSRADSHKAKLNSLALAAILS